MARPFSAMDAVNVRLAVPRDVPLTLKKAVSWLTLMRSSISMFGLKENARLASGWFLHDTIIRITTISSFCDYDYDYGYYYYYYYYY